MDFHMRNTTFISSMVLSVACVSAANGAFQSIDDFTIGGSAVGDYASRLSGGQFVDETASFGLSGYRQLGGQYLSNSGGFNATAASNSSSSVVIGSNKMSLSLGFLSDPTDVYTGDYRTFNITLANGIASLSNSDLTTAGVNLSGIVCVNLYLSNTYTTALLTNVGVGNIPSASLDISNFGVSGVPAPGAVALLGAAGLIGARRRRA